MKFQIDKVEYIHGGVKKAAHPSGANNNKYAIKQRFYWYFKITMNNSMKSSCFYCYNVKYSMASSRNWKTHYGLLQCLK